MERDWGNIEIIKWETAMVFRRWDNIIDENEVIKKEINTNGNNNLILKIFDEIKYENKKN